MASPVLTCTHGFIRAVGPLSRWSVCGPAKFLPFSCCPRGADRKFWLIHQLVSPNCLIDAFYDLHVPFFTRPSCDCGIASSSRSVIVNPWPVWWCHACFSAVVEQGKTAWREQCAQWCGLIMTIIREVYVGLLFRHAEKRGANLTLSKNTYVCVTNVLLLYVWFKDVFVLSKGTERFCLFNVLISVCSCTGPPICLMAC